MQMNGVQSRMFVQRNLTVLELFHTCFEKCGLWSTRSASALICYMYTFLTPGPLGLAAPDAKA